MRFLSSLHERPFALVAFAIALSVLALWQVSNLRVTADLSGLVSPQAPSVQALIEYQSRFGRIGAEEVILVSADSFAADGALDRFEDLLIEWQFVEGVEEVSSLFSIPSPQGGGAWLSAPEMRTSQGLHHLRNEHPLARQLLTPALDHTLVLVVPVAGAGGEGLIGHLRDTAAALAPDFTVQPVGLAEVHRAIVGALVSDLRLLIPLAVLICSIVTALAFRSLRAVIICALPPMVGLLWLFGWMGMRGQGIDPLMGALPVVLIVLGFSDGMHLYHAALHRRGAGASLIDAQRQALRETLPAAALTSATTFVAFASMALPDAPALRGLATAGMAGMVATFLSFMLLAPLLMRLLRAPVEGDSPPRSFDLLTGPAQRFARRRSLASLAALAVLAALLPTLFFTQTGFRYVDYLPAGSPVTLALVEMERAGLGSDRVFLTVDAEPRRAPAPPDGLDPALANLHGAARAVWGDGTVDAAWLNALTTPRVLDMITATDGGSHALPVQVPIGATGTLADSAVRQIEARLDAAGLAEVTRLAGAGYALMEETPGLVSALRTGLYLTILAATLAIWVIWRSPRLALAALVPNLIPILGIEAWLVVTGRELTVMNMLALTVAFGIAVDDTLHFLNRFRLAAKGPLPARIDEAISMAGPPMVATTAILLAGLLVTGLSAIPGVALFGLLIALAVALALVADIFLLPGLIGRLGK